jgi:hypothetical protein
MKTQANKTIKYCVETLSYAANINVSDALSCINDTHNKTQNNDLIPKSLRNELKNLRKELNAIQIRILNASDRFNELF